MYWIQRDDFGQEVTASYKTTRNKADISEYSSTTRSTRWNQKSSNWSPAMRQDAKNIARFCRYPYRDRRWRCVAWWQFVKSVMRFSSTSSPNWLREQMWWTWRFCAVSQSWQRHPSRASIHPSRYTSRYPLSALLSGEDEADTQTLLQKGRPFILRRVLGQMRPNWLAGGLSQGHQTVEVSADKTSSHRLMHNRILLRRSCSCDGGKSRNTKENQQG